MLDTVIERHGRLDIMCANSGIFPQASIAEMTEEDWDQMMNVNLKSTFLVLKPTFEQMQKQGYGRVVSRHRLRARLRAIQAWRTTAHQRPGSRASCAAPPWNTPSMASQ